MSTFIKVLNITNSTSKSLSGRLKELTNKAKNLFLVDLVWSLDRVAKLYMECENARPNKGISFRLRSPFAVLK